MLVLKHIQYLGLDFVQQCGVGSIGIDSNSQQSVDHYI